MRVISCVPSLTEWLFDLGVGDQVVGRTKFCVHPPMDAERVGGTKDLKVAKIESLKPDLVIANKEENDRTQIEACGQFADVLLTDIRTVEGAWEAMEEIAKAVGKVEQGREWVERIQNAWGEPRPARVRAAYCVWREPRMVAGGDTYISDVMRWWGIENAFAAEARYPAVDAAKWQAVRPEVVLLPSEPFPFKARHQAEFAEPTALVDGEAFSWYGSRMWHAVEQLRHFVG